MASIPEALATAIQHQQAGRLKDAEQIYRQILAVEPNQPDAWHLLGVLANQVGKHDVAIECIGQAIKIQGIHATFHISLGNAYRAIQRVCEAVKCYERAIELAPDSAEAHYRLGNAMKDKRDLDEVVKCYRSAVQLNPSYAEVYNDLGVVLRDQGQLEEAVACYRTAARLRPNDVQPNHNLGVALGDQGKLEEAIVFWRRAVELNPGDAESIFGLANALKGQGKLDEAIVGYERALELNPSSAEANNGLGVALFDKGKLDQAVSRHCRALDLKPNFADSEVNLGVALYNQGKLNEAVACYSRALRVKPDIAEAYSNLGNALMDQGKQDEAVACHRRALELKPNSAEAYTNLGGTLYDQGKLDEAVACYRRALELKPSFALAHHNLGMSLLLAGVWRQGWLEYEWRWRKQDRPTRGFPQPLWDGETLTRRTILLHAEQGLGDTIQFIRYASLVKEQGATVIFECQTPLLGLLEACIGIDQLIGQGDGLPEFDVHAPLLSLPGILKTSLETIPAIMPYLRAKQALLEDWHEKLSKLDGFKIGIVWQGNPKHLRDRFRSIPLRLFEPLARIPGVRLISLQQGTGIEQLDEARSLFPITDLVGELAPLTGSFEETAAVMKNLDLVLTVDSAPAHLAGALGVPVWVALPSAPDWRWLLDRSDSPWYPTMRLFRQTSLGDWSGVFEEIERALREQLNSSCNEKPMPEI